MYLRILYSLIYEYYDWTIFAPATFNIILRFWDLLDFSMVENNVIRQKMGEDNTIDASLFYR